MRTIGHGGIEEKAIDRFSRVAVIESIAPELGRALDGLRRSMRKRMGPAPRDTVERLGQSIDADLKIARKEGRLADKLSRLTRR